MTQKHHAERATNQCFLNLYSVLWARTGGETLELPFDVLRGGLQPWAPLLAARDVNGEAAEVVEHA